MKKLLLFLCLLTHISFSQSQKIDSLKQVLTKTNNLPEGAVKKNRGHDVLKALMKTYSDINIDSSMYYNALMIKWCAKYQAQKELIYVYQYAGYLYQVRGDFHQSIRFYYKALSLAEKLKQYTEIAGSHRGLAHAYSSLKEYKKATSHCRQGLGILQQHPDPYTELGILNVQGAVYREDRKFEDALNTNQAMYRLAQRENEQWYESQGLHAIGWVYMEMGDAAKALDYYQRALTLCQKIGSVDLEGSILLHIAVVFMQEKKWPQALEYCNLAKQTAITVKNSSIVAESEEKLYTIFKETNQPGKALKAYENFVQLTDSLSREKTEHRIETLQALYDNIQKTSALQKEREQRQTERKTRNVLLLVMTSILVVATLLLWNNRKLEAKNREIERQTKLLEAAQMQLADINKTLETRVLERTEELVNANQELILKNEEIKSALFKGQTIERKRVALELHDNLSSLLSAVNMSIQAIDPAHLSQSQQSIYHTLKHLIQNAYTEVRNISHNILPAQLEKEGLASALTTLVDNLNQSSPLRFSLSIAGLFERMPIEIEHNVHSIVWELVNNSIRHAHASHVDIALLRTDSGIMLSVTDDGVGLGKSREKRGVGLQNVQIRLESLGGTFDTVQPAEKGTQVLIKIPIETARFNGDLQTIS